MRSLSILSALFLLLCALGCEPEIGGLCDANRDLVDAAVEQTRGTNNLVQDVGLDNCTQGLCLSTDGSRPYCTKACTSDIECAEAGSGFRCLEVVAFGPLACLDYEDPLEERPSQAGQSSGTECASSSQCSVSGESCFQAGELEGTCGFAGRDCLTGENGAQSSQPLRYCAAPPDVIADRDREYGREPSNK
jgi:hypothetical protein